MEFQLDPNRLMTDELSYELLIRGASTSGLVQEKPSKLRDCLRLEKDGVQFIVDVDFIPVAEITACEKKLLDLEIALSKYGTDNYQNDYAHIGSRLTHISRRLARVKSSMDEETAALYLLVEKCSQNCKQLRSKFATKASAVLIVEEEQSILEPCGSNSRTGTINT